jgi:aspartate kinase
MPAGFQSVPAPECSLPGPSLAPRGAYRAMIIVIKFGGTSLASPRRVRLAARRVRALRREGLTPVVVVSAAGQSTDRLLAQWQSLTRQGRVSEGTLAREADRYLATGEDRSASLLAGALLAIGVPAVSLRGGEAGIRATGGFGAAVPESLDGDRLSQLTNAGHVPVVAGFQASRADGEVVTLGRGGSDLSAVFLAMHLGACECWIVTDVAGVCTADPRHDPSAALLPELSHAALVALTVGGAVVVHPGAAIRAAESRLPLRVFHHAAPFHAPGGTMVRTPGATPWP